MTRLLVTSDWQLGKGGRLADQRDVVLRIAALAVDEGVDGVLLGGDILEGPAAAPEQLEVVTAFLDTLQGRIPCLGIVGNGRHDLAQRDRNGLEIFNHVDGIEIHSDPATVEFAGAAVGLLPWVHPGRLIASMGAGTSRAEINAVASDLLLDVADKLHQGCAPGLPTLLLGHWHVDAALNASGGSITEFVSEPVIPYADLEAQGWDVIALAHNHRTQKIGDRGFHIGSPLPLDFGETGWEHGVWIVDLDRAAVTRTFVPIESRRLVTLDIDITGDEETSGLAYVDLGHAVNGHDLADALVRFRYRATADQARRIDIPLLRRELLNQGAAVVTIQPDIVRQDRARVEGVDETLDEQAAMELYIQANGIEAGLADRMRVFHRELIEAAAA